jgi:hypothetical protein
LHPPIQSQYVNLPVCSEAFLNDIKLFDEDIKDALYAMDTEVLTSDVVGHLLQYAPTHAEQELLRNFKGSPSSLRRVEKFFLAVMDMPFYVKRLDSLYKKLQIPSKLEKIKTVFICIIQCLTF